MKEKKLNFFERVKIAVFKLEEYGKFVDEKLQASICYFFIMALLLACIFAGISANNFLKMYRKGTDYVKNEFPNFQYADGKLQIENYSEGYDDEYKIGFVADTSSDISEENINEYKSKFSNAGIILLADKMIYISGGESAEYTYSEVLAEYDVTEELSKDIIIEKINSISDAQILGIMFVIFLLILYITEIISLFSDWVVIAIFAWLVSRICRVNLNFKNSFIISIYALTLPIFLTIIYEIANVLWGFQTEYFRMVYLLVSYVYIVAVILMMKSDIVKQEVEIGKIKEVQKKVHDELNEDENKDEQEEKNTEENTDTEKLDNQDSNKDNKEPDGSET